jgi:hypothetical protein
MRTPEGRWRLALQGLSEAEILDQVRVHLEKEPLADARERPAFANAVRSMRTGTPARRRGKRRTRLQLTMMKTSWSRIIVDSISEHIEQSNGVRQHREHSGRTLRRPTSPRR